MAANGVIQIPIPSFMGINQSINNMSMQYATYAENVDTSEGRWRTAKGVSYYDPYDRRILSYPFANRIDKIVRIPTKQFYDGSYVWYIFKDGKVYSTIEWASGSAPAGYDEFGVLTELRFFNDSAFSYVVGDVIDCVLYQEEMNGDLYDVVIFTGKQTGCFEIYALYFDERCIAVVGLPEDQRFSTTTPHFHFSALCQYKERIFGVGQTDDLVWDRIYYSQPFKPNDWEQIDGNPEESGGIIDYPTWDNDEFVSLVPFGGYLVAFKRRHGVIISGAYPGEYNVTETFGTEGVVADGTVQVGDGVIFYLSDNGIGIYDGNMIRNISRDSIDGIVKNIDFGYSNTFCSNYHNGVYSVSVRTIEDTMCGSTDPFIKKREVIEYDHTRGTFMLRTGVSVDSFYNDVNAGVLVACSEVIYDRDAYVCIGHWNEGNCYFESSNEVPSIWISPWNDCGHKESTKSGFRIRCQCEGPQTSDGIPTGILKFAVETERKKKEKWIRAASASATKRKMIAKNVSNRGRQFRFIMQNKDDMNPDHITYKPLNIDTGLQVEVELDSD